MKFLVRFVPKYLAMSNKGYTFAPANEKEVALLAQLVEQYSMDALLAQLVEQLTLNQWVQGSSP